jgi:hypothetical protein
MTTSTLSSARIQRLQQNPTKGLSGSVPLIESVAHIDCCTGTETEIIETRFYERLIFRITKP